MLTCPRWCSRPAPPSQPEPIPCAAAVAHEFGGHLRFAVSRGEYADRSGGDRFPAEFLLVPAYRFRHQVVTFPRHARSVEATNIRVGLVPPATGPREYERESRKCRGSIGYDR